MKARIKRSRPQLWFALVILCVMFAGGCSDLSSQNDALRAQLIENEKQAAKLQKSIAELKKSGEECRQQTLNLQGLSEEQKKAGVPDILDVVITGQTGIYDAETPDREPRLMVYFKPIDDAGDAVKAGGAVHIELWDLGQAPEKAKLEAWDVSSGELKKTWSGSLLSSFYRLEFKVPKDYSTRKDLTVKLTFTDYFTGKSFSRQLAIKSR
jgi:hypothetical protein